MILLPLLLVLLLPAIMGGYVPPGPRFRCPKEPKYIYPCACVRGSDRGLYVRCENTNLASLSLAFSNLGNEGMPIEELVLYKCNIGELWLLRNVYCRGHFYQFLDEREPILKLEKENNLIFQV